MEENDQEVGPGKVDDSVSGGGGVEGREGDRGGRERGMLSVVLSDTAQLGEGGRAMEGPALGRVRVPWGLSPLTKYSQTAQLWHRFVSVV